MNDVYDHAPECDVSIWLERAIETDAPRWLGVPDDVACQCQKLQACEARVLSVAGPHNYTRGRKDGYIAALDRARDAVAGLPHEDGCCSKGCACQTWDKQEPCDLSCNCSFWWMPHALAAIDALRGEQS